MVPFSVGNNTDHCLRKLSSAEQTILHALISIKLHWVLILDWDVNTDMRIWTRFAGNQPFQTDMKPISCSLKWAVLLLLISLFKAKFGVNQISWLTCAVCCLPRSAIFAWNSPVNNNNIPLTTVHFAWTKYFISQFAKRKCLQVLKKTVWLKCRNAIGENEELIRAF